MILSPPRSMTSLRNVVAVATVAAAISIPLAPANSAPKARTAAVRELTMTPLHGPFDSLHPTCKALSAFSQELANYENEVAVELYQSHCAFDRDPFNEHDDFSRPAPKLKDESRWHITKAHGRWLEVRVVPVHETRDVANMTEHCMLAVRTTSGWFTDQAIHAPCATGFSSAHVPKHNSLTWLDTDKTGDPTLIVTFGVRHDATGAELGDQGKGRDDYFEVGDVFRYVCSLDADAKPSCSNGIEFETAVDTTERWYQRSWHVEPNGDIAVGAFPRAVYAHSKVALDARPGSVAERFTRTR